MFFIGIFGIDEAEKSIGTYNNAICPACGAMTRFEIIKKYSYFHIFFIPTFRWNIRYYLKPACCSNVYELDTDIGREYEKDNSIEVKSEHMRPVSQYLPFNVCSNCSAKVDPKYSFCPYCGKRLQ